MIGHLRGTVIHQDVKSIILDVGGVGYKVFTNTALLPESKPEEMCYWTYLSVRENALDLYGFTKKEELEFFELLLGVSGIGPKSALSILTLASLQSLRHAVQTGDTGHLTKVSGIGKKNAEKIVLELKDKLSHMTETSEAHVHGDVDALLALQSLGYSERDSREALKKAIGETTEEKVRSALKNLNS